MKEINEESLRKNAGKLDAESIGIVVEKAEEIFEKFKKYKPLKKFFEDVTLLIALVKAYWNDEYREVPYRSIAAIVFTLLYVLNPIDLIPDFIPGIGLVDDVAVMYLCLKLVGEDLEDFKKWQEEQV